MADKKHTPEPWSSHFAVVEKDNKSIARCVGENQAVSDGNALAYANAARIVACVNALAGLNPEAVADVVAALEDIANEQTLGFPMARAALAKLKS